MIPQRPANLRLAEIELGDLVWFEDFVNKPGARRGDLKRFCTLLVEHCDWTAEEVSRIRGGELRQVFNLIMEIVEEEKAEALPLASGEPSSSGELESVTTSPAG